MQKLTLQEIFILVATEKARRENDLIKAEEYLNLLYNQHHMDNPIFNEEKYSPFKWNGLYNNLQKSKEFSDVLIVNVCFNKNGKIYFHIHMDCFYTSKTNEEYILSLTSKERENCYVIVNGKVKGFCIAEDKKIMGTVIFEGEDKEVRAAKIQQYEGMIEVMHREVEKLKSI